MTYATSLLTDLRGFALVVVSAGCMVTNAMADPRAAKVDIASPEEASNYIMRILSAAGCRMRFDAFQERVSSDGLARPSGEPGDPAAMVAAAPFSLLNEGLIAEDPGATHRSSSRGVRAAT